METTVFRDNTAQSWSVTVNVLTLRRMRDELGIELTNLTGGVIDQLSSDVVLLVDCLWIACSAQAESRGVSAEQFAALLTGDVLDDATGALLRAIASFFPSRQREILNLTIDKGLELQAAQLEAAEKLVSQMDLTTFGAPSTSSPELPE